MPISCATRQMLFSFLLLLSLSAPFAKGGEDSQNIRGAKNEGFFSDPFIFSPYPNFSDNPLFTPFMRGETAPFLIPLSHPIKPILDAIFSQSRAIADEKALGEAGFQILYSQESSFIRVARHPALPGYLFKIYLDNEIRIKGGKPGWYWLKERCEGAKKIRRLIKKKGLRHFVVPEKWIYPLPLFPSSSGPIFQPIVLVVTDMNLVTREETKWAWKNLATVEVLDELYTILSHGYGSFFLTGNIPYSRVGQFALIDTEYPKRVINLKKVKGYLSEEMGAYWEFLIKKGGYAISLSE